MNIIPIVFASDDNYIAPTYIAILSLLDNSDDSTFYDIYIMCPNSISKEAIEILYSFREKSKCSISIVNMGNRFKNINMKISHITSPTYYRLCLPMMLEKFDKCIYLDSDIIVKDDLTELYNYDMDGYYIGGVIAEGIQKDKIYQRSLCKRIGLPDTKTYVNAGVLVFNLDLLRKDDMMKVWIELTNRNFPTQDQDIINLSCWGKIKLLPLKYNIMTKCDVVKDNYKSDIYSIEEVEVAKFNPVIIHYADKVKPWNLKESILAEYWWEYFERIEDEKIVIFIKNFLSRCETQKETFGGYLKRLTIRVLKAIRVYGLLKMIQDIFARC